MGWIVDEREQACGKMPRMVMWQGGRGFSLRLVSVENRRPTGIEAVGVKVGSGFAPVLRRTRENPYVAVDSEDRTHPKGASFASSQYFVDSGFWLAALER